MIKRAYAYLRVSTFQQVDGKSLTGQEEEIRKYCNVYGIELVDVYSDEGKSGKSIEGRPQFQKMLRDIKEKQEVDYVIVWKLSRFGRNACDSLNSLNILQDNGVNLVALTENVDTATPMGRLVFTLLAALAEMERENIREQTANGLKYNALSGGWNGGIPPYGYDAVNKELVINEEEAAVVRKIFEWYLESEEASCDSVTGRLNEEGIKPRHYKRVDRKATEESETDETVYLPPVADWYTSQVKKILDNPTVCGKIRYGYHKTDDGGNKGKQSGDSENDYILVDGKHEAIISEEMWNRAQEKRKKSRKPRGRRDSTSESVNNVFNGIVKCPQCGAHMINYGSRYKRANGEESYYSTYVCGYWNNHKKGKCRKNPIKTEILEKAVIGGLREYTRRPNLAEEIHQYMEQELDTGKLEKETEELKNKIAALDKNEDMQYKILCQIGVNPTYQNMKPERIQINLDKIATEKKELQEKLDYKMKQIESVQLEKMDFELVKNLLENFNEVYEDAPKELRKRLVRSLIKEVQLGYDDKGKVVPVKMILKFSGEQIELMKEYKENFGLNEAHADQTVLKNSEKEIDGILYRFDETGRGSMVSQRPSAPSMNFIPGEDWPYKAVTEIPPENEKTELHRTCDQMADQILSEIINDAMDQRQKAEAIYNWVRGNIRYSGASATRDWVQEAYQGLRLRRGDCFTYYSVSQLLLSRAGIAGIEVVRSTDNHHYWNLVNIDGSWYHFDATPRRAGGYFFLWTDDQMEQYSRQHGGCFTFDRRLYPATPE